MSFKVGSRVRVKGLVAAAAQSHNGKLGTVCSAVEQSTGRVFVKLDDGNPRDFLKIKPSNLDQILLSSAGGRKLLCRLDVSEEASLFTARPLHLLAFLSRQQAVWGQPATPLSLHAAVAHIHHSTYSSDSCLKAEERRRLIAFCRLSVMVAMRFLYFQGKCPSSNPKKWALRHATSILSRRRELPVERLGSVPGRAAVRVKFRSIDTIRRLHKRLNPRCVAFDGEGNLVVSDGLNHCIEVFRWIDGVHLRTIKGTSEKGRFNHPWGVAFDDAGHIIVSEYEGHCVQVLRYSDGAHVCTIGSNGSENGQFKYPSGIAIDCEGNVAVFDDENGRVQVHRLCDGTYVRTIGSRGSGNGQFGGGRCVAFDYENNIVVADRANHRVQVLRYSDGVHLRNIGGQGTDTTFKSPSGVAFDNAGHIVIADRDNHCVQVLRYSDGAHVRTIGGKGSGQEQFNEPSCIAIDRDGCIAVADTQNNRVQVFK
jgi:hypothetical protein